MRIDIKKFENKVKEIQKKDNYTNKEVAEIMDLDYSYLFRIFKNDKKNYSANVINGIERFCNYFNLEVEDYIFLE